ncbi:hypothetical protein CTAYLR_010109 [Chrysophaeum taylorii]|uniref:Uroporphyrinogen decarboxylase n=1 Tax=Chrysophaeum taylorii TaxID=2483200 RepID=A0AAD7U571_9STRA|nr:hypothetical protein CTAYLR_010109 [Chrysophaeum taylorii]
MLHIILLTAVSALRSTGTVCTRRCVAMVLEASSEAPCAATSTTPLLLRAARGEGVSQTPVWMMRQAGRHMQAYRDLVKRYPTFRERSEIPEAALEISLQPFEAYGVDGVILFSDILTPLPAMGVDFAISEGGTIAISPIRTREALETLRRFDDVSTACPFVGQVLGELRAEIGDRATVLGFVGLPFTLATYLVEGKTGTTSGFSEVAKMREEDPELLHSILSLLADNIGDYACYQIESGAQVIQVFDSWAGHLDDASYETFALPYQQRVVSAIKARYADTPVIVYMAPDVYSEGGRRLPMLAKTGADIISVDHTIDFEKAREIVPDHIGLQGNLDPKLLRDGPLDEIKKQTERILRAAGGTHHVMNLGHGIEADTPEPHAAFFVDTVHAFIHDDP